MTMMADRFVEQAIDDFALACMNQPRYQVARPEETDRWFERVFGRPTDPAARRRWDARTRYGHLAHASGASVSGTAVIDSSPGLDDDPQVVLEGLVWRVDGMAEVYRSLRGHGITLVDQFEERVDGDESPSFFTDPQSAGLRYEFVPRVPSSLDERVDPRESRPAVPVDDPLGLECCLHHTVLTDNPQRALRIVVDVLGGIVVHEGRNDVLGASSTYVHLSDSILEYAVPDEGTAAHRDWSGRAPADTYHSITWKVIDLDRTVRHLKSQGVGIRARTADAIMTDPTTSVGVSWGFRTSL